MIENNRYYWSHLKTKTASVRVRPKKPEKGVVFRVGNMIDLGAGRQTIMLEHVDCPKTYGKRSGDDGAAIPFCMGELDFIYTSKGKPKVQNVSNLLSTLYKGENVEKIVSEVLAPGDLLVFKQGQGGAKVEMVQALRVVKENSYKKQAGNKRNAL